MASTRLTRLARGSSAAALATFVALLGHVIAGGELPGPMGVVAPLVLSITICTFVAGLSLSVWRVSASVVISQALFHALFVLGTGSTSVGGHHLHALTLPVGNAASLVTDDRSPMWLGHGAAALVTIAALYFGERLLDAVAGVAERFAGWVMRGIRTGIAPVPLPLRVPSSPSGAPAGRSLALVDLSAGSRRGPPLCTI